MKLEITKGEWYDDNNDSIAVRDAQPDDGGDIICDAPEYAVISMRRWKYHSALIVDAGNTYQRTGLLPSELEKQRDELLKAMVKIKNLLYLSEKNGNKCHWIAEAAIKEAEK